MKTIYTPGCNEVLCASYPLNKMPFRDAFALLAALLVLTPAVATDLVQVQNHGDGRYTLSTTLDATNDPAHGQLAITPKARELCGNRHVHFEHYQFEAIAPSVAMGHSGSTSLRYTQDIVCRDTPQEVADTIAVPVPPAPPTPPTEADAAEIRERTLAYLHTKATADADAAYPMLSHEMASYATPDAWAQARRAFNAKAGPDADAKVIRISWYDNPQEAPSLGRYAAADYRVDYPSRAFTCGYVVWLRQTDGGYLIVREEEGQATPDLLEGLTPEQTAQLRAQLQCRD